MAIAPQTSQSSRSKGLEIDASRQFTVRAFLTVRLEALLSEVKFIL